MTPESLAVACVVCTPRQLEVVELRQEGRGWRLIGRRLEMDPSTARAHWRAALRRIAEAEAEAEAAC